MMSYAINVDFLSISFRNIRLVSRLADYKEMSGAFPPGSKEQKLCKYLYATRPMWEEGKGRKIYKHSIHCPKGGWTYFWSDTVNHSVIEFTGRGCEQLRIWESLLPVMRDFRNQATRIDVAVDFASDMKPSEFASKRGAGRFKSNSHISEDSGDTEYVGSWDSDRFARVYRYNEPHPRAGLLRIEHVNKGEWAKATCNSIVNDGLSAVVRALGETFQWQAPLWTDEQFDGTTEIQVPANTRTPKTDRWLLTQVLPAIKKLHEAGSDDVVVYFLEQAYNIINDNLKSEDNNG